jgi:hypothetical protein
MLGESDDGRRLHATGVGDVAYAHDDHLLAMLGDVLRDEFELLGEIVVFAGDPLNQILNPVVLSHVIRYPPLDKLRAIVAQHDFGIPLA